jgi:hypothetical protein
MTDQIKPGIAGAQQWTEEDWQNWSDCAYAGYALILRTCVKALPDDRTKEPLKFGLLQCYIDRIFHFMLMVARDQAWFRARAAEFPSLGCEMEELHGWTLGSESKLSDAEIKEGQNTIGNVMCSGGVTYEKVNYFVEYLFAPKPGAARQINKPAILKAEETKRAQNKTDDYLWKKLGAESGAATKDSFIKHLQELRNILKAYAIPSVN